MDYSEKDIENTLMADDTLYDIGINPLWNQVRTEHGIIDILGFNRNNNKLTVIELKKGIVDENAVGQIMRYIASINDYYQHQKETSDIDMWQQITGVEGLLIGSECTPGVSQIIRNFGFLDFCYHHAKTVVNLEPHAPLRGTGRVEKDSQWISENTDVAASLYDIFHRDELMEIPPKE